jgi:hypothetical protein
VDRLVIEVILTSDRTGDARTGRPVDTVDAQSAGPLTLTSDVPAGTRSGSPVDSLVIDVFVTSDVHAGTRTGSPVDAIGNTVTNDVHAGTRSGSPVDALIFGVTLTSDVHAGTRSGSPVDTLKIGVTLTTDVHAGTRTGSPVDRLGNTITSDVHAGTRTGRPVDAVKIGVRLTSDVHAGTRTGSPVDALNGSSAFSGTIVLANANWPMIGTECDFSDDAGPPSVPISGSARRSLNSTYRRLVTRKFDIRRGRQYELDQVQTGTCTVEIPDPLEALNPDNAASPFNTSGNTIQPYRPFWMWAMWPNQPGDGNIFNQYVDRDADPSFESGTGQWAAQAGSSSTVATSTTQAWTGTQSLKVIQQATGAAHGAAMSKVMVTGTRLTYTMSAYVYPTGGCSVTLKVTDAAGSAHTSGTATVQNTWTRISVTWNTIDTLETVVVYGTGVSTPTFYVDGTQLEFGQGAGTFTLSGPRLYPLFVGYVERFPTAYDMAGLRAVRPLQAIDALGLLSLTSISQSYAKVLAPDAPQFQMKLDDSTTPPRITGNPSGFGVTSTSQGGSISFAGDTLPDGTPAVSVAQQEQQLGAVVSTTLSSSSAVGATSIQVGASIEVGSYINIDNPGSTVEWAQVTAVAGTTAPFTLSITKSPFGIVGLKSAHSSSAPVYSYASQDAVVNVARNQPYSVSLGGATFEGWFRPVDGDITYLMAGENLSGAVPTYQNTNPWPYRDTFVGFVTGTSGLLAVLNDSENETSWWAARVSDDVWTGYPDGQWHYYAIKFEPDPGAPTQYLWTIYIDEQVIDGGSFGTPLIRQARFNQLVVAASTYTGAPNSSVSAGQVAYYPYALSDARIVAHRNRGFGNVGEITGARVQRLLDQYWGGESSVAAGVLALSDDFTYDPTVKTATKTSGAGQNRTMLDVLQEIQESERGLVYASLDGTVVFEDRGSRYVSQVSLATFGEDPTDTGAEYPYAGYETDFDPTYTFSQANLTSTKNGNFLPIVNTTAQARYGQRVLTQQLQCVSDFDLEQAGVFYLTRYGSARTRISKITLRPAANPSLWPLVLAMEISQRYTVKRRSQAGTTVSDEYYVESVQHTVDPETGEWACDLQMSPVFVPSAWVLGDTARGILGTTTAPIY